MLPAFRESPGCVWSVEQVAANVDSAELIVRARAIRADSATFVGPGGRPLGLPIVVFEPIEWLRGTPSSASFVLRGVAVDHDDFNDKAIPYQSVRPSGRRSSCSTMEYRLGQEYLLLLKTGAPEGYTAMWWPLGPANEQLRGDGDHWLAWVRARVASRR